VLVGRRLDALKETLPNALCVSLDHSNNEAVAAFAAQCPELDGMFLNAGQFLKGRMKPISWVGFHPFNPQLSRLNYCFFYQL